MYNMFFCEHMNGGKGFECKMCVYVHRHGIYNKKNCVYNSIMNKKEISELDTVVCAYVCLGFESTWRYKKIATLTVWQKSSATKNGGSEKTLLVGMNIKAEVFFVSNIFFF